MTGISSSRSRLLPDHPEEHSTNDDLAELHVYAGPDNPVETAAISWLVVHEKEPQEVAWQRPAWFWWRKGRGETLHTLPESLYRHLPGCNPLCSWCRYESYQEAIAAFVAAYAAWQSSAGANEPGKGV